MSRLKYIKRTIYNLKRRVGLPLVYHIIDQHVLDVKTGEKTITLKTIKVDRAIVLSAREFTSFVYDLAFISANKDFTMGGFFDPEDRRVILDLADLGGHNPQVRDYFIFQNRRYDIKEVVELENNSTVGLLARAVEGQDLTIAKTKHSGLLLTDAVSAVVVNKLTRDVVSQLALTQILVENP